MLFQSLITRFVNRFATANHSAVFIAVAVGALLILLAAVLAPLLFAD